MKRILHFLFGKGPDIFDSQGEVRHNLPKEKWSAWDSRYHDEDHNWKKHAGSRKPAQRPENKSSK